MLFKKLFITLAFICFSAPAVFAAQAPDFVLQDTNGNTVKLSDYKGKVVFVDFWASWCPPCRASIPAVKALHKDKASNSDFVVLGINSGEKIETVKSFMEEQGMDYPVLLGTNSVSGKYKVNGIPAFFIIDKEGNIANKYVGYSNGLEKQWRKDLDILLK